MSWTDPEKRREYKRKWYIANREKCKAYSQKWRATHIEHVREYDRKYRKSHREQINKRRRDARKKNIPAGDGIITVDLYKRDSWWNKAYSTERVAADDMTVGYDELERYRTIYRRTKEYE